MSTLSEQAAALARLSPITARAITRPVYRNERIRDFRTWYFDNEPKLSEYYQTLTAAAPAHEGPMCDFFEFAACQHESTEAALLTTNILTARQAE